MAGLPNSWLSLFRKRTTDTPLKFGNFAGSVSTLHPDMATPNSTTEELPAETMFPGDRPGKDTRSWSDGGADGSEGGHKTHRFHL
jgi:hypothetical protein